MKKFYIIGIDDNGQREFQAEVREIITTHRVFSGGKRHYELMRDRLPEQYVWIDITVPLEEVLRNMPLIAKWWFLPRVIRFFSDLPIR